MGIFSSEFGAFGVMICLDAEQRDLLSEILESRPFVIFNPSWIPSQQKSTRGQSRVAMESFARTYEVN